MRELWFPSNKHYSDSIVGWVAERLEESSDIFRTPYGYALWDTEKGELLAGFVLHDFTDYNVMMSIAVEPGTVLTPRLVWQVMQVPFEHPVNAKRVTAFVDETNERSVKLIQGIGFAEEGRVRKHFGDHDALIYGLLREEFYGGRYGKQGRQSRPTVYTDSDADAQAN